MKGKRIVMPAKRSATLEDFELDEVLYAEPNSAKNALQFD